MATAQEVGDMLATGFLLAGNYGAGVGPMAVAAAEPLAFAALEEAAPFAGLSLQAVAHEEGTDDPSVFIYLTKGSAKLIKDLPKEVAGIPVVTKRMGPITVRPEATAAATNIGNYYETNGRTCCGSSCAPTSENTSGTFGALVRVGTSNDMYVLSNNHVLGGCNHVAKKQPILSPSNNDGRAMLPSPKEIARHHEIVELRTGTPEFVQPCESDVAIATVTNQSAVSSWQGDAMDGYDTPGTLTPPISGMAVKKFGRTTGLTHGIVEAKVNQFTPVTYNARYFKGKAWFTEVWTVRATAGSFALGGDSGSLVVAEDGSAAVGLLFAGNPTGDLVWIIPFSNIVAAFPGITLVHGHGI
jgi:hypothetical protein